ncbi:MAG: FMN-binding negative transcriptional regulator, partial [Actinomycetota bacterium]|nr:FMN-binding negative transcriptional regulator [Actinomycetota bacterium]
MRHTPKHASDDAEVVRQLIRENPWAILVSSHQGELVASHYPILLDEAADGLAIVTHVGRPDDQVHGFGDREMMLIVQGRHGYISPSWYAPGAIRAPTWNFSVAHCYGVPQLLDEPENLRVLGRLVEHFERHVEQPMLLDPEWGAGLAKGTVGLRLPITRFVCKIKLSA